MTDALSSVRLGYDRWASIYDHDANPLQALEGPIVRSALGDVRGLIALDLGCGTGRHALWLAASGAIVTALDFSPGMLALARRKPGSDAIRFLEHDLHNPLPLDSDSFDLLVSGLVLEHIVDLDPFFTEARRVLRSGGRAVISAMHPAMFLRGAQARFTDPTSGQIVQPGSIPHSISAFILAAVSAGFTLTNSAEFAPDAAFAAEHPRREIHRLADARRVVALQLTRPRYSFSAGPKGRASLLPTFGIRLATLTIPM